MARKRPAAGSAGKPKKAAKSLGSSANRNGAKVLKDGAKTKRGGSSASDQPWFIKFAGANNTEYIRYMRDEWGWEKRGDNALFEKLCLEGQQAGLSWATILAKRGAYRKAFHGFNVAKCAAMSDRDVGRVLAAARAGPGGRDSVLLHRGKLLSIAKNARCVLELRSAPYEDPHSGVKHRTLDGLLWSFVGGAPVLTNVPSFKKMPVTSPAAKEMSRVLKKRGFSFIGPTICYSLMQSCGLVIDHPRGTPEYDAAVKRLAKRKR
eukprot:TRINITY_DN17102_c0_g1_i3.p1 TRINITY_DN17102_c0_g1~~TRINITY_DN17102_c0_g1_i3.p1  ORF type:complete len:263 (+),score=63.90 TRINITY_DN17102_c0_g1_i3:86-874(+)